MKILNRNFFCQDTLIVARNLLGKKLVREINGKYLSGIIVETEAYLGTQDSACHSFKGRTPRNSVMFGPPGVAYVYFVYGMHYLFNVVTEKEDMPCAVLFRAIVPVEGKTHMEKLRGKKGKTLTNGPAKLCQAMAIDKTLNGWDLTRGEKLWFENYKTFSDESVCTGPRIGINYAKPEHREAAWRFWVK